MAALLLPFCFATAQDYGLTQRPTVGPYFDGLFPAELPRTRADWSVVPAFPQLTFINPVGLTPVPGTTKLVVWEREGKIWVFDNDPAVSTKTLVVDLSAQCQGWDDSGLLGVALHPNFASNRQMYIWYNWRGGIPNGFGDQGPVLGSSSARPPVATPTRNRLSRFVLDAVFQTPLATEDVLIDQKDATVWHNGGGMFFHPSNGFLYITNGDDNSSANTQRIDQSLFSCVIRIDVDQRGGAISHRPTKRALNEVSPNWPRYFVPNDNPFVGMGGVLEEIFALGLRSPHRMTIDPPTGRIFIGDVGSYLREEINVIDPNDPPGINFQWSRVEGKGGSLTAPYIGTSKGPIIDYGHNGAEGYCVVGGYVYRGAAFPELYGKYIFGDNLTGNIWSLDESTPATKVLLGVLPDGPGPISGSDYRGLGSFGVDAAGELYICQLSSTAGGIYKLQRGSQPPGAKLPATLSQTGFFSNLAELNPDARLLPYDLNAPFWSDGAVKKRFVAIPSGTAIRFQPTGEWSFPSGSVFVKHFNLPISDVDPTVQRRLETRVLVKKADGEVYGATYKWREDQLDADLLDGALTESVQIATLPFGDLQGQDIGSPDVAGSTTRVGDEITIQAGGTNINGSSDQFHFAHQVRSGDFDVAVRIVSLAPTDLYTRAGLMVRESLAPNAANLFACVLASSNFGRRDFQEGYGLQVREFAGSETTFIEGAQPRPRVNYPNAWLRLRRQGHLFVAFTSEDGSTWQEYARRSVTFPTEVYFGFAVTARSSSSATVAKFHVGSRRQSWYYPSPQDCITCHTPQAGGVLGLSTRQLNRDFRFANGVTDNQLRSWSRAGYFHNPPYEAAIPAFEKLAHHTDTNASLELRARSYLDANCASCHRPGVVQAQWDARFQTPLPQQGIIHGIVRNTLNIPSAQVVRPQDPSRSILHHRISSMGPVQMPPLARNLVDLEGVRMLTAWIQSLEVESLLRPTDLTATALSRREILLSWKDASHNEVGFSVERGLSSNSFSPLAVVGAGVTNFKDRTAEPFTTYFYRVTALGQYASSDPSVIAAASANAGPPAPGIQFRWSSQVVSNGDISPSIVEGTDFHAVNLPSGSLSRSFHIYNVGNASLQLSGTPFVRIAGADAASFNVTQPTRGLLFSGQSSSLMLRFQPSTPGLKTAQVVIESNDPEQPVLTFAIQGMGMPANLDAWWGFDETSGTKAADRMAGNLHGTLTAMVPTWVSSGQLGGAISFSGEAGQSVTVPNNTRLNPPTAVSFSLWLNPVDWDGGRYILQKGNSEHQYRLRADGVLAWEIAGIGRAEAALPPVNIWSHVVVTYDGAAMNIYVNGQQVATRAASGALPVSTDPLYFGTRTPSANPSEHYNGLLDDVRMYSRALSATEVSALMLQSSTISVVASDAVAQRGMANPGLFSISRSGSTATALPVTLSLASGAGHAVNGTDFTFSPALTGFTIPAGQSTATLAVTPLPSGAMLGVREIVVSLKEAPGYLVGPEGAARVQLLDSPMNTWKILHFGSVAAASGPLADNRGDPDGDGMSTLLEAALGTDPIWSDSARLPVTSVEMIGGRQYLTSTYVRPRPALPGLTYQNRTTFDLATGIWNDAVVVNGYPVDNLNGTETHKVRSSVPIDVQPRQFIRLEVAAP